MVGFVRNIDPNAITDIIFWHYDRYVELRGKKWVGKLDRETTV